MAFQYKTSWKYREMVQENLAKSFYLKIEIV